MRKLFIITMIITMLTFVGCGKEAPDPKLSSGNENVIYWDDV